MTQHSATERSLKTALFNGWRRRCPRCGKGRLLFKYLKVHDICDHCALDLTPQRADDGPAYLTILLVGHIVMPALHIYFVHLRPSALNMLVVFITGSVVLSLYLLPRLKGMVVGFQWAREMHGFKQKAP